MVSVSIDQGIGSRLGEALVVVDEVLKPRVLQGIICPSSGGLQDEIFRNVEILLHRVDGYEDVNVLVEKVSNLLEIHVTLSKVFDPFAEILDRV